MQDRTNDPVSKAEARRSDGADAPEIERASTHLAAVLRQAVDRHGPDIDDGFTSDDTTDLICRRPAWCSDPEWSEYRAAVQAFWDAHARAAMVTVGGQR